MPACSIVRTELLACLQRAGQSGCRLSLLCTPPGYGKSTLMAQYVAGLETPWAWLRCEAQDNQPLSLLLHLRQALGLPAAAPEQTFNAQQVWAEISSHLEQQAVFTLVLDDLHELRSSASKGFINDLLRHAPAGLHLLAGSQGQPQIAFGHLRRNGQLQLIDSYQLELSSSDIEALARARGTPIASALAYQLRVANEGWISGVLMGLQACVASSQALPQFSSAQENQVQGWLSQYFREEVLAALPPRVQHLLERLSLLNAWDDALAVNLSGFADAPKLLERLLAADVFIRHSPEERLPYQLHPQLRLALYQRALKRSVQDLQKLHRQAAQWLLQQRCYTEAMLQLGRGRDFKTFLLTLEQHSFDLLREGKVNEVMAFMAELPGFSADDHLTLTITEASVVTVIGDIQRAAGCMRRLQRQLGARLLSAQRRQRSLQTLAFLRSRLAYLGGNYAHGIEVVSHALHEYPQSNAATAVLLFNRGSNLLALGQLRLARRDTEAALAQIEPLQFAGYANLLHWQLGQIELAQGQFDQAKTRFTQMAKTPAGEQGHGFYDLYQVLGMAQVVLQAGETAQASAYLAQAETLALGFAQGFGLPCVLHHQGLCLLASGKTEQARARWDEARRLARSSKLFGLYRQTGAQRVRLAVRERDQDFIMGWLGEWHWCTRRYAEAVSAEEWLAYAWVQRHLGQHPVAGKIVQQLREQAELEQDQQLSIELHILSATLCQDQGERGAALQHLEQALQMTAAVDCSRLLLQEGRELEELWRQLLTPTLRRQYELLQPLPGREQLAGLLRELGGREQNSQALAEPLTRREQDVLRRIAQGQQNQQIADALFISLSTVKTHINNLFRKLDAADREAAVQVARALNLVTEE